MNGANRRLVFERLGRVGVERARLDRGAERDDARRLAEAGRQRGSLRESKSESLSRSELYLKTFAFTLDGIASH